jgi:mRNA-degrading endonuclease toxin of MazEF toxin-antitoxin module
MRAGDVLRVDFDPKRRGSAAGVRPAIVVQRDSMLDVGLLSVMVVPCTNTHRGYPSEVTTEWGVAQAHLAAAISVDDIVEETERNVGPAVLAQIRELLALVLDLD